MNETKNTPEKRINSGGIVATIWQNQGVGKNGEAVGYRTVSFQKSYKDKNGVWQKTTSLRVNDLPKASLVLQKAYEYLAFKESDKSDFSNEQIIEEVI